MTRGVWEAQDYQQTDCHSGEMSKILSLELTRSIRLGQKPDLAKRNHPSGQDCTKLNQKTHIPDSVHH